MNRKSNLKTVLCVAFLCVTLGGFLLHARIHLPSVSVTNYIPFITGIFSALVLTVMFSVGALIPLAYLINGMLAIIGTITMTHFSIHYWPKDATLGTIFLGTLLADIIILWTSFCIGKAIFELETSTPENLEHPKPAGRFFRYPNMGYWGIHIFGLSLVYTAGHIFWK